MLFRSTLRPTPNPTICDAIISTRVVSYGDLEDFNFILCTKTVTRALEGVDLSVTGTPYLQQDAKVGVCAQAALRILSLLKELNGGAGLTMPEITRQATEVPVISGRDIPSSGLTTAQMIRALKDMKLSPQVYNYQFMDDAERYAMRPETAVYRYIESGIPVLLAIRTQESGHALVAVGHTFEPNMWWPMVERDYYGVGNDLFYRPSATWVDDFVVQDDNLGSYTLMPKEVIAAMIDSIIVPLPQDVNLLGEDAELGAWGLIFSEYMGQLIADSRSLLDAAGEEAAVRFLDRFNSNMAQGQLVLRTYLSDKEDILKRAALRHNDVATAYNSIPLPDRAWVCEVSYSDIFCQQRECCGEVILDPTAVGAPVDAFLLVHLPSLVITRDVTVGDPNLAYNVITGIPEETSYGHLTR